MSEAIVRSGFITGQQFRQLSDVQRLHYAIGLLDGALLAPVFGAPRERMTWLETCTKPMTPTQISAMLARFVDDNPSQWHVSMNVLFGVAMRKLCPQVQ